MAATIAKARGYSTRAATEVTRLGHEAAEVEANTYRTFTLVRMEKDGSATLSVEREVEGQRELLAEVSVLSEDTHPPRVTVYAVAGASHHTLTPRYPVDAEADPHA